MQANEGMDFAAHNVTIEWARARGTDRKYKYFLFLNSSVRGPFYPAYMPATWQWTHAFTDRLSPVVKASSLATPNYTSRCCVVQAWRQSSTVL